jgi:hypothetical protein
VKTAIYIDDGITQIVLTAESEFERKALVAVGEQGATVKVMSGRFYACQGGWIRNNLSWGTDIDSPDRDSLILRLNTPDASA